MPSNKLMFKYEIEDTNLHVLLYVQKKPSKPA